MKTITNCNDKVHPSVDKKKSVVFRCDTIGYMGDDSDSIVLYSDGALVRYIYDCQNTLLSEQQIQTKTELVNTIRRLARDYKAQLNELPRSLYNPFILDGADHKIQIGRMKFGGPNILTTKIKEEDYTPDSEPFGHGAEWIRDLARFQKIFEHFRKAINESVGVEVIRICGE